MATVRYCNVHRENDKITRHIRSCATYSNPDVPVWVVVLARMVNRITSLDAIRPAVEARDLEAVKATLKRIRDEEEPIWGNAYTISTCGKSMDKVDYVIDHVVDTVRLNVHHLGRKSLDDEFRALTRIDGLGSFLAGQVVADLKNTVGHPLSQAPDFWTFAVHGPGSLRGLSAYFGYGVTPRTFTQHLSLATQQVTPFLCNYVAPIHAQDMQNCFCEFSKYIRVRSGGRARNTYDPSNPRS